MKERHSLLVILFCIILSAQTLPVHPQSDGAEILAHWDFSSANAPAKDSIPNDFGGQIAADAQVLEYAPGAFALVPCLDEGEKMIPHGLSVNSKPQLIPEGAMTFETWFNLSKEANDLKRDTYFLVDKKVYHYATQKAGGNGGYCLLLRRKAKDTYVLELHLGFGTETETLVTLPQIWGPDVWHRVAFTYNGKGGAAIYVDDICLKHEHLKHKTPLAQNTFLLTIGDRSVSNYNPFPGLVTQAVLYKGIPDRYGIRPVLEIMPGRDVFYRFDKFPGIKLRLSNTTDLDLTDLRFLKDGQEIMQWNSRSLASGENIVLSDQIDTSLKPGNYENIYEVKFHVKGKSFEEKCTYTYDLTPRPTPYMPVVMWQTATDLKVLKDIGFTQDLLIVGSHDRVLATGAPVPPEDNTRYALESRYFNNRARMGLHNTMWFTAGSWLSNKTKTDPKFARLNRNGHTIPMANADVSLPYFKNFVRNVGESVALQFGNFTSVDSALIHSEVRDNSAISFRPEEIQAAEEALGCPIPDVILQKNGVDYKTLPDFPVNRVVPKDDPILKFYSWWWKYGDGWNDLHSIATQGIKSTGRDDIWTFFDPAVRTPSVWGSGGNVDVISQWTYAYPDPIKLGEATDELFAMAEGNPNQKVMKMTQVIWYRNKTAPIEKLPADEALRSDWEKRIPDARFLTIAPDHLEIALWSMLARPVQGIMYHGWNSLTELDKNNYGYEFTNSNTQERLKGLLHSVVKPLGPTLLQIPDPPARIAILESFASQIYNDVGTWGWSESWEADVHLILQWAGYQPQIIYDETIRKNGLDQFQVLVMPNCAVLSEDVVQAIEAFQRNGGILVSDERLCPALLPDHVIPAYRRKSKADVDKAELQRLSAQLRKNLEPYIQTPFRTSNMDLVGRLRKYGNTDYLFVINDKRTFGDYIGKYRLCMEQGLPNQGSVTLERPQGFVFDLVTGKKKETEINKDGQLTFRVDMAPGEGKLFMICDNPMEAISIDAPKSVPRGKDFTVNIKISDKAGHTPNAVVPLQIILTSTEGEAEGTGFYAAKDGRLTIVFSPAPNDIPGTWKLQAKNLANGTTTTQNIEVE